MAHLHSETQIALPLAWEAFRQACRRAGGYAQWTEEADPTLWDQFPDDEWLAWRPDSAGWRCTLGVWGGPAEAEVDARRHAERIGLPTSTLEADHLRCHLVAEYKAELGTQVYLYLEPQRGFDGERDKYEDEDRAGFGFGFGWIYIARHEQPSPAWQESEDALHALGGIVRMYPPPAPATEIELLDGAGQQRRVAVQSHVGGPDDGDWEYVIDGSDPETGYLSRGAALVAAIEALRAVAKVAV